MPLFLGHRYSSSTRYRYCWVHALDTAPSCMGEGGRTGGEWEGGKWRRSRLWVTGDAWEEQLESGRRATASGTRTSSPCQRRQALSDVFQYQSHINHPGCRAAMQQRLKASVCCLRHAAHVVWDDTPYAVGIAWVTRLSAPIMGAVQYMHSSQELPHEPPQQCTARREFAPHLAPP